MGRITEETALPLDVGVNLMEGSVECARQRLELYRNAVASKATGKKLRATNDRAIWP
jgi:hypothetical protein